MSALLKEIPKTINHVIPLLNQGEGRPKTESTLTFATHNQDKLAEFARILGDQYEVRGVNLSIPEIQDEPLKVLEEKAIEAWRRNGCKPIIVEDTSLMIPALNGLPGAYADAFTKDRGMREKICRMVDGSDRSVKFQVGLAVFDGYEVHARIGEWMCTIAESPRGANAFGFDDIIEPNGQTNSPKKTNAQMDSKEKDLYSPRRQALEKLLDKPFDLGTHIFELPPPYEFQLRAIRKDRLQNQKAIQHAFNLEAIQGNEPNPDFKITQLPVYYREDLADGAIARYTTDPESPSIGLLITPIDTAKDLHGEPVRLKTENGFENLVFWQMGLQEIEKALAVRAYEFMLYHNDEMYEHLRAMMRGEIVTQKRSNQRSEVIEELIKLIQKKESEGKNIDIEEWETHAAVAIRELGYARQSTDEKMSRTEASRKGLIINVDGTPTSIFSLGGMPPVTGWKDVLTTAALSFHRSWIPHNSIYAENPDLQLRLFNAAVADIDKLELPEDIRDLVVKQIGISVGSENPEKVANFTARAYQEGCRAIRIYTTNPDYRTVETARLIRQACPDMFICVGPIVDIAQAKKLNAPDIKINMVLCGHGGGENCTSLEGGGAANGLELAYLLSLDPEFNDVMIGVEGGTGNTIGAILGFVDTISLNRRAVAGGIEAGGLFVENVDGVPVQPYNGSASSVTQWIEAMLNEELAEKRLNDAGDLNNVEGKPNDMAKARSIQSIVQNFWIAQMFGGRSLADQRSRNIGELRENIVENGYNHRAVSNEAFTTANAHRPHKKRG